MAEPRIDIKVVDGRFVSCWPMPEPREDEHTFYQSLHTPKRQLIPDEDYGLMGYMRTREDQSA